MSDQPIAIIGAGLSGLCLALALHRQQIPCTLYESRPAPLNIGGAIMLSPNALRILDKLGGYERIVPFAYHFDTLYFRTADDKLMDTYEFGGKEKHGYQGVRIYRFELIQVLLDMLSESGIKPVYGKKFVRVVREDSESVSWAFEDGSEGTAPLLIGADGIHSRVRTYIKEGAAPIFTKMIGVSAAVPTAQLKIDESYPLPVTIMSPHGAFVAAPQRKDGSEVFFGKQCRFPEEPDREGWDRILNDKEWCKTYLRKNKEDYPPIVANAVSDIPDASINVWPFHMIPKLGSWTSDKRRVIILGDAAHAIPPTAGQGINQAFEDVYTFAGVMSKIKNDSSIDTPKVLKRWQDKRQERIDGVLELNDAVNKRRLPSTTGGSEVMEPFDLRWLYDVDFEKMVEDMATSA